MSRLRFNKVAAPSAPASGKVEVYASNDTNSLLRAKDAAGIDNPLSPNINYSTVLQTPAAATRVYITGSNLSVPAVKLKVGTIFKWRFNMTKTGAGLAASTFDIAVGTAGTTADTARVSFTKPAGTAVADEGWVEITAVVRSIGASGIMVGEFIMTHNLSATGHAVIPCVVVNTISSGFDMTVANLIVGLCITSGTADVITIQMVVAEALNL